MPKGKSKTPKATLEKMRKNAGRKSVFTEEVVEELKKALLLGVSNTTACKLAGIEENTFYVYMKNNPNFSRKVAVWKNDMNFKALHTLQQSLKTVSYTDKDGNKRVKFADPKVAMWWAERKMKDEFSVRVENTGADGKDLFQVTELKMK